ncbi:MAG: hypothetical protein MHMPM18_002977 [Marteilia pararefringens]
MSRNVAENQITRNDSVKITLVAQNNELREKLEKEFSKRCELKTEMQNSINDLKREFDQSITMKESLEKELELLRQNIDSTGRAIVEKDEKIEDLNRKFKDQKNEFKTTNKTNLNKIEDLEKKIKRISLEREASNKKCEDKINLLVTKLDQKNSLIAENFKMIISMTKTSNFEDNEELNSRDLNSENFYNEFSKLKNMLCELEKTNESTNNKYDTLKDENLQFIRRFEKLEKINRESKLKEIANDKIIQERNALINKLQPELQLAKEVKNTAEKESKNLKSEIEKYKGENVELKKQFENKSEELESSSKKLSESKKTIEDKMVLLQTRNEELIALKRSVANLQCNLNKSYKKLDIISDEATESQHLNKKLEFRFNQLQVESTGYKKQIENLESLIETKDLSIADMEELLKAREENLKCDEKMIEKLRLSIDKNSVKSEDLMKEILEIKKSESGDMIVYNLVV